MQAEEQDDEGVRVPQAQIRRDPWADFRVFNTEGMTKAFRYSSSKRWRLPDGDHGDSLPFGYAGEDAPIWTSIAELSDDGYDSESVPDESPDVEIENLGQALDLE